MGTEIPNKIREAIKKKLIELHAFLDEELPDYIMVMVANKKTKKQMETDLFLFLGSNTRMFTDWLHSLLHGGQVTDENEESVEGCASPEESAESGCIVPKEVVTLDVSEDDVLALNDPEHDTDDFLNCELQEDVKKSESNNSDAKCMPDEIASKSDATGEVRRDKARTTAKQLFLKQNESAAKVNLKPLSKSAKNAVTRAGSSMSDPDEYDPQNPYLSLKSVANKVFAGQRKSSVPIAHQANKLLLLKAVEDANKSILGKQNIAEVYKPTPIKVLVSSARNNAPESKMRYNVDEEEYDQGNLNTFLPKSRPQKHKVPKSLTTRRSRDYASESRLYYEENEAEYQQDNQNAFLPKSKLQKHKFSKSVITSCRDTDRPNLSRINVQSADEYKNRSPEIVSREVYVSNEVENENDILHIDVDEPLEVLNSRSPQFVVTLDGVDSNSMKRKWDSNSLSDTSEKDDVTTTDMENMDSLDETKSKRQKLLEKCRFWPSCKNGEDCEFHHPTVQCKTFPNCTYGDKCFYIHPNCKFNALCSRKDCPYTHTRKRDLLKSPPTYARSSQSPNFRSSTSYVPPCKYFPNCNTYKCPYLHPKNCRFGNDCQSPTCAYIHPLFPARNQLKWKADT